MVEHGVFMCVCFVFGPCSLPQKGRRFGSTRYKRKKKWGLHQHLILLMFPIWVDLIYGQILQTPLVHEKRRPAMLAVKLTAFNVHC